MSDQGEKTCPICTEEMDLTDQQLKPCKCGYQICVWCWHHIMDMAEKDGTEGRCPACRSPYNKEKIVGMAANCGRLVAEVNIERKMKAQKAKSKTAEGRKQLSSVRVIQRNLVYIVGLPLNLADEDLLQRKEFFGQYGKVLKVSISRTAAGAIQHFANSTCSVYITYSMEEEAVRCIQSVHGFVLDERSLRACFGTTKYCHSWLRNVPCSNPECLYLHEIGLQEDCFSKDEMISAYTRSRVQQISGATNNVQRSGNMLPPPAEEYCINSFASPGKPTSRIGSNNSASCTRGSPPNGSSGRVAALPAAASWATLASSCQPPSATIACSDGISKQKPDTGNGSVPFSTAVAGTTGVPLLPDGAGKKRVIDELGRTVLHNSKQEPLYSVRQYGGNNRLWASQASEDKDTSTSVKANLMNLSDRSGQTPDLDEVMSTSMNGNIRKLCSDMESMNVDERLGEEQCDAMRPNVSLAYDTLVGPYQNQVLPKCYPNDTCDISVSREESSRNIISVAREQSDQGLVPRAVSTHTDTQTSFPEVEEDLRFFAEQRLEDPEVGSRTSFLCNSSPSPHLCSQPRAYTLQQNGPIGSTNLEPQILDTKVEIGLLQCASSTPAVCNGYHTITSSFDTHRPYEHSYIPLHDLNKPHVGRFEDEAAHVDQNAALDLGERIIISNILSMDFDALDEPMAPTQNFAKLMGDTDKPESHLNLSNSWKVHNNNQSRFSFAREEQSINQISEVEQSFSITGQVPKDLPLSCSTENSGLHSSTLHEYNRLYALNYENSDNCTGSLSHTSNKLSVSRGQVSAPPGFSLPNKTPPPGFASQDRMEPIFNSFSDNYHLLDSSMLRNPYQAPSMGINDSAGDIEFMDPAILAVGKGRLPSRLNNAADLDGSNFQSHLTAFENEARMQLMMQSSLSPLQNRRFADMDGSFSQLRDSYRFPSGIMEQTLASNLSHFSQLSGQQSGTALMPNGHWDGWSESRSPHDLGMAEVLRNEILGFNKVYNGYEDSKFRLPSSGDLYGRTYGI